MNLCTNSSRPCCAAGQYYSDVYEQCVACNTECPREKQHTLECQSNCPKEPTTPRVTVIKQGDSGTVLTAPHIISIGVVIATGFFLSFMVLLFLWLKRRARTRHNRDPKDMAVDDFIESKHCKCVLPVLPNVVCARDKRLHYTTAQNDEMLVNSSNSTCGTYSTCGTCQSGSDSTHTLCTEERSTQTNQAASYRNIAKCVTQEPLSCWSKTETICDNSKTMEILHITGEIADKQMGLNDSHNCVFDVSHSKEVYHIYETVSQSSIENKGEGHELTNPCSVNSAKTRKPWLQQENNSTQKRYLLNNEKPTEWLQEENHSTQKRYSIDNEKPTECSHGKAVTTSMVKKMLSSRCQNIIEFRTNEDVSLLEETTLKDHHKVETEETGTNRQGEDAGLLRLNSSCETRLKENSLQELPATSSHLHGNIVLCHAIEQDRLMEEESQVGMDEVTPASRQPCVYRHEFGQKLRRSTNQPNRPIYDAIKRLPFVEGFQSEGASINVYIDFDKVDRYWALAELCHVSGAQATKFHVQNSKIV